MRLRLSCAAFFLVPVGFLAGCELPGPVPLPIDLDSPPVDLDFGAPVDAAILGICSDPSAPSCEGVAALCAAENDGTPCDPVTLPQQFLKEVDVDGDSSTPALSAEDALGPEVAAAAKLQIALPVDLGSLMEEGGVGSSDQVEDISFDSVTLAWLANTLTFDAPVLDVYVGPAQDVDALGDVGALIASADFEKVGTISKEEAGVAVGQIAGIADEVPLNFISGGKDAFNERLRTFSFTFVVSAPEGQALKLKELANDPTRVARPDGVAQLSIRSKIIFTVNLGKAAGL